ncbi:MAG: AraC family transcriptional regulator of adaptative response, partial [Gammaproteobacteria bacterium]
MFRTAHSRATGSGTDRAQTTQPRTRPSDSGAQFGSSSEGPGSKAPTQLGDDLLGGVSDHTASSTKSSPDTINTVFWRAVLERDSRYNGIVFYAVVTTGVFCRPTCPSRRPRPENVRFFNDVEAALLAGFRACKRCRPESEPEGDAANGGSHAHRASAIAACRAIEASNEHPLTLAELADRLALTPDKVRQLFKRTLGVTHKQYADAVRIERFKASLIAGESIACATYDAGYGSSSRVYERAGKRLGMTPGAYKRAGKGERVEFVSWQCEFGAVLVASTAKGICSVKLGACSQVLESALREEFGQAHIERLEHATSPEVAAVRAYLDGCGPAPTSVPTDVAATAFQARVWSALRTIPAGETRSYSEVAAQIGSPRAVRA